MSSVHADSESVVRDGGPVDARSYARAILNILEDAAGERARLEATQKAVLNILDDSAEEKARLADTQRAALNILDDFDIEKKKVEQVNVELRREITARARGEEALRHAKAAAEGANRELEAFSYSVAHDLRGPLRHIDGFADLLGQHARAALDEKAKRYLDMISDSAKSMGALIDDLLVFSRMGRSEMQQTTVDLGRLVAEVRQSLEAGLAGREIEWRVAPLPAIQGDPAMLKLALANLISNAIKYTGTRPHARIEIGSTGSAEETTIYVRDNGVGFDMEYGHKLFGVFQRLHSADEFEGTGIGLANVRRIIQRHGGRTWAEGEIGRGATFYFSLPRRTAEGQETREAA